MKLSELFNETKWGWKQRGLTPSKSESPKDEELGPEWDWQPRKPKPKKPSPPKKNTEEKDIRRGTAAKKRQQQKWKQNPYYEV